jgi:hypothetical protein
MNLAIHRLHDNRSYELTAKEFEAAQARGKVGEPEEGAFVGVGAQDGNTFATLIAQTLRHSIRLSAPGSALAASGCKCCRRRG